MIQLKFMTLARTCLALASMSIAYEAQATIFYVNASASSGGNGSSWTEAFNNLDAALIAASETTGSDQIWIAKGTYVPSISYGGGYGGSQPNLVTFNLPSKVALYGGFIGNENHLSARNPAANPTILSGNLGGGTSNAWHVVTIDGATQVSIDGVIITDGYAGGPDQGVVSAKSLAGQKVTSVDFYHTGGGGVTVNNGQVTFTNVTLENNTADATNATMVSVGLVAPIAAGGGAIAARGTATVVNLNNCTFINNSAVAAGCNGGALNSFLGATYNINGGTASGNQTDRVGGFGHFRSSGHVTITGATLTGNKTTGGFIPPETADASGGALGAFDNSLSIINCVIANNSSTSAFGAGGGLFYQIPEGSTAVLNIINSTFNGNATSAIGGGGIFVTAVLPDPSAHANIINCQFYGNSGGTGGAGYFDSLPTTVVNCLNVTGNTAQLIGGAFLAGNFINNLLTTTRATVNFINCDIYNNTITGVPTDGLSPVVLFNAFAEGVAAGTPGVPPAEVTAIAQGGGALASEFGGIAVLINCNIAGNSAGSGGFGDDLLVGGTQGFAGTSIYPFNQASLTVKHSLCTDTSARLDPAGVGSGPNGVQYITDGSCPL
jgi:hypothetical protein